MGSTTRTVPRSTLAALAIFVPTAALAQAVWTQRASTGPAARNSNALAYDAARAQTINVDGYNPNVGNYDDVWSWNGSAWTQRASGPTGPEPRDDHSLVYDSARAVAVLFGGTGDATAYLADTWEWNGAAWTQRNVTGPAGRLGLRMAYDAGRGVTVLFGGTGDVTYYGDTWEYNGTAWTQRASTGPAPRYYSALAYDSARGVTVLFGGRAAAGEQGDTWEWNGAAWTQRAVAGPSAREGHCMAYDASRGVTVLFGGYNISHNPAYLSDTWEWNGTSWTQLSGAGPSGRTNSSMAYDSSRHAIVLFGGSTSNVGTVGDTWELGSCISFASGPGNASVCSGNSAQFSVAASGAGTLSYQWQIETAPGVWQGMGNDPGPLPCGGGAFSYAGPINSPSVTIGIHPCPGVNVYHIRCLVTGSCGSATSPEATFTFNTADFNGDGDTGTDADIEAFFACLAGNCCATCGSADFNADGDTGTDADIESFFRVLAGGAC